LFISAIERFRLTRGALYTRIVAAAGRRKD
jgi:hypothetical protein